MAIGLAEILVLGLLADWLFRRFRLPGLIGMLLVGALLGPSGLGRMDPILLAAGPDLRLIALIVILLRAGFELNLHTLRRVGYRALLLACLPSIAEGVCAMLLGPSLLGLDRLQSAILGFVLAAVSPAVVVPAMIRFKRERRGTRKGIPTMIMAAASVDNVFVIVVFSALLGLMTERSAHLFWKLGGVPVSLLLGAGAGLLTGWLLFHLFDRFNPRATKRALILMAATLLLVRLQHVIESRVPFTALVAAMAIGFVILEKREAMAHELSAKLAKIWIFAEILLFALVGAQVNPDALWSASRAGAILLGIGLAVRGIAVLVCLAGSGLSRNERVFVAIANLPKATVQAAIGATPLLVMRQAGMDTRPGEMILAVAVLSIVLTAPLGAWAIHAVGQRVLPPEPESP